MSRKLDARFWSKVDIRGEDECWPWKAGRFASGYGAFNDGEKIVASHRAIWQDANGAIPSDVLVCHSCDNRGCCNIHHFFIGSHLDNMRDKVVKGRQSKGEMVKGVVLTAEHVVEIRSKYVANVYGYKRIAHEYGIGMMTVRDVIKGVTWEHIP